MTLRRLFNQSKELVSIDPSIPNHSGLLKRAYDDVYCPAFPIEEERAPLQLWLDRFAHSKESSIKYSILVAGETLLTQQPKIEAMAVGIYYSDAQAGFMPYVAVADEARGQGYLRTMVGHLVESLEVLAGQEGQKISAMFFEVNDPAKVTTEESGFDSALLVTMYKKIGAYEVALDSYVQPAQGDDLARFDKLKLLYFLTGNKHPTIDETLNFIRSVYKGAGVTPELSRDFTEMERQLKAAVPHRDFT